MRKQLVIRVCENFYPEVNEVIRRSAFPNVRCLPFPARCKPNLISHETFDLEGYEYQFIFGSCCLSKLEQLEKMHDREIIHLDHCFEMITSGSYIDHLLSQKAYLVSPGWSMNWKKNVSVWGDHDTVCMMLKETVKTIIYLDTEIHYPEEEEDLRELGEYLDIPTLRIPIGLDYCNFHINNWIRKWNQIYVVDKARDELNESLQRLADYAMTLDLLGKIPTFKSREEVSKVFINILTSLFAPKYVHALSYVDGIPESFRSTLSEPYDKEEAWNRLLAYDGLGYTADLKGFYFPVYDAEDILVMLEINDCEVPQNIPRYLNLCESIAGVLALSINNGRTYEKLIEEMEKVETLRGIIPICSHCKQIRTDKGAWQQVENYIASHSAVEFSHSICPSCMEKYYPEVVEKRANKKEQADE